MKNQQMQRAKLLFLCGMGRPKELNLMRWSKLSTIAGFLMFSSIARIFAAVEKLIFF
jgi:hypothetical protein